MKKGVTRMLSVFMGVTLLGGSGAMLAGCGGGGDNTFTIWIGPNARLEEYYSDYGENPTVKFIEKKFDVNLEFIKPIAGSETDQFNLLSMDDNAPEVMELTWYTGSVSELYDQGVALDLTEYMTSDGALKNYKAYMDANPAAANEIQVNGHYYQMYTLSDVDPDQWGGWSYRKDLVFKYGKTENSWASMDDIRFPSGEEYPVSIADWDFMLSILKKAVDAGDIEYCLALPSMGYHETGELLTAFGVGPYNYLTTEANGKYKVNSGADSQGFKDYLAKMREWYLAGYIQSDFSTENANDAFYAVDGGNITMGKVGVFYGLMGELGNKLYTEGSSVPQDIAVYPMPNPGQGTYSVEQKKFVGDNAINPTTFYKDVKISSRAFMVTHSAKKKNLEKLLEVMDYLYSEEGSIVKAFGLTAEQAGTIGETTLLNNSKYTLTQAACDETNADPAYASANVGKTLLEAGCWYKETVNGSEYFCLNPIIDVDTGELSNALNTASLWGLNINSNRLYKADDEVTKDSRAIWNQYGNTGTISTAMLNKNTPKDLNQYTKWFNNYREYMQRNAYKFITGEMVLNRDWDGYVQALQAYGCQKAATLVQTGVYDKL